MNKYATKILTNLLEKYERSVLSKQGSCLNLQIKVKLRKLFPKYDNSDYYSQRLLIDEACHDLNNLHILTISIDDDGIDEIALVLDDNYIKEAYRLINRVYLPDYQLETINHLKRVSFSIDWLDCFKNEMIKKIKNYQSISRYLNIENIKEIRDTFVVLQALTKQKKEISFRKFSLMVLKDSKRLENIKSKLVNIVNDYYSESFQNEDELFGHFNVIKNPGFVYLSGQIKISLNDQIIDIGKLNSPFSLTTENIKLLKILEIRDANVLAIENLTSFYDTVIDNTLIIYLGGYHNALRRELLLKIYQFKTGLNYYHFGDIDAGGFYIYLHLVEKTNIPFKTIAMNIDTLLKYQEYTKKLTANDRKRLIKLKERFHDDVIDYMLENDCKLEQEIVELHTID